MSVRVVVDTGAWTALQAGNTRVAQLELANRDILVRFRAKLSTVCVPTTDETAEWFAEIRQQLKRIG